MRLRSSLCAGRHYRIDSQPILGLVAHSSTASRSTRICFLLLLLALPLLPCGHSGNCFCKLPVFVKSSGLPEELTNTAFNSPVHVRVAERTQDFRVGNETRLSRSQSENIAELDRRRW